MKLGVILLGILVLFVGYQTISFWGRERESQKIYGDYKVKLDQANVDLKKLQDEVQYYENKANVEKALKGEFNYKAPGENLMIIVPGSSTVSVATATEDGINP